MSASSIAGGGAYSPYVVSVVDVVRMMENFHTAAYQYIPALALPKHDELNLKLNNPPPFINRRRSWSLVCQQLKPRSFPRCALWNRSRSCACNALDWRFQWRALPWCFQPATCTMSFRTFR